jgi:hypothetical protein
LAKTREEATAKITQGLDEVLKYDFIKRAKQMKWLASPKTVREHIRATKAAMNS